MLITPYRTKIVRPHDPILDIIDEVITALPEKSVLAVTSKIVGIAEGRVVPITASTDKYELIKKESEFFLDDMHMMNKYKILLTVKNSALIASAGIDESNGDSNYVLWPEDPFHSAYMIWQHVKNKHNIHEFGVVLTDSKTTPLRWGVTGYGISWCGFHPLYSYIGNPDIFGRLFKHEQTSILDSIANAATLVMGEGDEQSPLAVISDIPKITFSQNPPTKEEIHSFSITFDDDLWAPLTKSVQWKKGGMNPDTANENV